MVVLEAVLDTTMLRLEQPGQKELELQAKVTTAAKAQMILLVLVARVLVEAVLAVLVDKVALQRQDQEAMV
jgi:hypothetical protein